MKQKPKVEKCEIFPNFLQALSQLTYLKLIGMNNADVDRTFSFIFYNKFNKILNKPAPFETLSKRRIKQLSKPWITKAIRTAIKIKNNLYMSGNDA